MSGPTAVKGRDSDNGTSNKIRFLNKALLSPLLLLMIFSTRPISSAILNEKEILTHLYHNLNGDNWGNTWNVSSETQPCSHKDYPGVICDNSHVIEINLADNNLIGSITPHLYTMPHLKKVDFSKNQITNAGWDRIDVIMKETPNALLNLLQTMDLTNNRISTVKGVDNLKDTLTGLHMSYNNLKGTIPEELFSLHKLQILAISENSLTGKIDTRIGSLTNLKELYCYGNLITGAIPTEIGQLSKLQILTLAENHLTGALPAEIRNLGNLKTFSVHNNNVETGHSGPLPQFDTHPFLSEIYLDGNSFVGSIPHTFLNMFNQTDQVVNIGLADNMLTGTVPDSLLKFHSLNLNVVGNNITSMDSNICESEDISSWMNGLVEQFGCDAIMCPVNFYAEMGKQEEAESPCKECTAGTSGFMGATKCSSDMSNTTEKQILAEFYLSCLGPQWDTATGWDVMIDIESPYDLTLPSFDEVNHCNFFGVTCVNGQATELSLPSNGLEGMIPSSLWDLPALKVLDLSGNELYLDREYSLGDVGKAKNLEKLDLSSNDIQKFDGIGQATSLKELYLDDAYFSDSLSTEVYKLINLKVLHIQYAGLKGQIPSGLSKLTNLVALNLYGNELTGKIPTEIGLMTKLWHIDLSENDFTGELPIEAISNLTGLQKFHVHQSERSKQGITGKLPSFKEQTNLHMLDLSSNALTGSIPSDFLSGVQDVSQLMSVNIGYNGITGTVPESLSVFSNMTFDAVKTKIKMVSSSLCSLSGWMNGEVGRVINSGGNGCDAILCPKGTFNNFGRANSGINGECQPCSGGEYAGATTCPSVSESGDNSEKVILDKIYVDTAGSAWTKEGHRWDDGVALCSYQGIICKGNDTALNEGVTEINLAEFGLVGTIPSEIYRLPLLQKVDFSSNNVDLSFVGIEQAISLESIVISDADVTSILGIGNAPPSLKKLHIERNSFPPGQIPKELYSATSLQSISISFNGFNGPISSEIAKLTMLEEFFAGGNDLTGPIPTEMTGISTLQSINLSGNRMSGEIPNELEDISTLRSLNLASQREFGGFSGPLPSFDTSPHLHLIDFSKNSLTGSIPSNFLYSVRSSDNHSDYSGVQIDLSSNQITGAIPTQFDDFASLFINLAGNKITSVPSVICDDDDEFQNGLIGQLAENKCDAILCPKGKFTAVGRQIEVNITCEACPGGEKEAPYYGSMKCHSDSEERKTLQSLFALIFTGASESKYWNTENPICTWYGITCFGDDLDEEGVIEINLEDNSLSADDMDEVSKLFFDLPYLQVLNIRGNDLPLKLDNIGMTRNLTLLQISATGLTSIAGIENATELKELHVTENKLSGPFPSEILGLANLEKLFISFNEITGPLPTRIGHLTHLRELFAYTNHMTGTIPTELGKLSHIQRLVLGKNKFEGTLPTELNLLTALKELSFYSEDSEGLLNGTLLDFSRLTHLESLDIEGNKFTGSIPSTFLSGLDSEYISSSENEITLHLASNSLTGTLPQELSKIENLFIDIAGNNIKGPLPASFCQKTFWMNGKVGDLMSCDAIACPANTYNPSGRSSASVDDDNFQDCKPCGGIDTAPYLGSFVCNHGVEEVTALKALYHATNGASWTNNVNWMDYSKPICSWYGVKCSGGSVDNNTVTELRLPANNLEGTLPSTIYELPYMKNLDLRENSIFMGFDNIYKAHKLETLYISDIDIGNVRGLGHAPALKELHLTANDLSGTFPDEFFNLTDTLEQLFIAYNSFSGTLSSKFGEFKKLTDFYAYNNDFTGTIPPEFATLENLENLVLAENKLSGTIPGNFSNMPSLKLFSAYRRMKPGPKLTGHLPSFSNVPQLEGLYLDYNHLSGPIPDNFLSSSLNTKLVTISHNSLTGEVPVQLDSFESLILEMEGNKISDLSSKFCDNNKWMNNAVQYFACDAILCPPHTYSDYGRQNNTESACKECDTGAESTPYWGSITCEIQVDEVEILKILYNRCGGDKWNRNDNWMTAKDICTWYGIECRDGKSVQAIRLGANNLIGTPPKEIYQLKQLHTLWLHSNPIDFKFSGIEKAQNLIELRLDATGLSDLYGLENAKSLIKLDLKFNEIDGPFPQALLTLEQLEELELTDNLFTGNLPVSFGKATNLISLRLGSNEFSGQLQSFSDLEFLLHLDLSGNKLEGTIPVDFLDSVSTRKPIEVDLSSNKLSGQVPTELDRFENLVIYLRDNRFTQLPSSLCDQNNKGWNLRDVELFGCNAIMCPPGTANYLGRQSSEHSPCEKCSSNTKLYGQVSCDGVRLSSSHSHVSHIIMSKLIYCSIAFMVVILL